MSRLMRRGRPQLQDGPGADYCEKFTTSSCTRSTFTSRTWSSRTSGRSTFSGRGGADDAFGAG
eukprot:6128862-Heterocapsa_arctica.AAC.1